MAKESFLQQHPLERIINVSWGGEEVFIATNANYMYYGKIKSREPGDIRPGKTVAWTELDASQFNFSEGTPYPGDKEVIDFAGMAYAVAGEKKDNQGNIIEKAKSVFVLACAYKGTDDYRDTGGVFFKSNDGRNWTKVFNEPDVKWPIPPDPTPVGMEDISWNPRGAVWDANTVITDDPPGINTVGAFYVAGPASKSVKADAGSDLFRGEFLYRSPDGENWTRVNEKYIPHTGTSPPWTQYPEPSMLLEHCTKPENKGPLPDATQAYDSGTETFMKPAATFLYHIFGLTLQPDIEGAQPSNAVTIERPPPKPGEPEPPPPGQTSDGCWSVAYADGLWAAGVGQRGGFLIPSRTGIDISTDEGKTWENVFAADNRPQMSLIIGGKLVGVEQT